MLEENIITSNYISCFIEILCSLLVYIFVHLLLVRLYFLFYWWCVYTWSKKLKEHWLKCPPRNLKYLGLHSCLHTGQDFLPTYQYTATPTPPSYVYIQSAVLPPIKMFLWSHSIKKCSPKLEVKNDLHGFIF